jgi:hypothetical protein
MTELIEEFLHHKDTETREMQPCLRDSVVSFS